MPTNYAHRQKSKDEGKSNKGCGCGCGCAQPCGNQPSTCCDLICFDRPRYFCGHLLTDTDLSREQRYVIEKNKLYHRGLHGHGVVCGLRLTCDDCAGHVRIEHGWAIDDCGNDLVLCETTAFDVLGALRERGLLLEEPKPDPCADEEVSSGCDVRQCFYVSICYQETQADFTTPFVTGCDPGPSGCEATRVREGVRFDVSDRPPHEKSFSERLRARFRHCGNLLSEGPFAGVLKDHRREIEVALLGKATSSAYEVCCKLRGYLLLHLQKHPDRYDCALLEEVQKVVCPSPDGYQEDSDGYGQAVQKAMCRLLELAYQNVVGCFLGELAVPCDEPCEASCVVLGTVVVEKGRVVRVCNAPREYVWSFANFWEVLLATLLQRSSVETGEDGKICCRDVEFDCVEFMRQHAVNRLGFHEKALAYADGLAPMAMSFLHAFDFTSTKTMSAAIFKGLSADEAMRAAKTLGVSLDVEELPPELPMLDPIAALRSTLLQRIDSDAHFVAYRGNGGQIVSGAAVPAASVMSAADLSERLAKAEREMASMRQQLQELTDAQAKKKKG